jgi:NADH:ubiquinone oxidoreductase subunit E
MAKAPSPVRQDDITGNVFCALQRALADGGYITPTQITEIAGNLKISESEVYGVATFYSFLPVRPVGRHIIRVCRSLPCHLKNVPQFIAELSEELGIKPGETTADGKFSLLLTNCIGACDKAPAMLVDNDVHGDLTLSKIADILKEYL